MSEDTKLKVLTFNCWGLKYFSKNRIERIAAIANALASADHDIITLQELWVYADYEAVRNTLATVVPETRRLKYSKFFHSGALGSGLVIFSRFPIVSATIHPYSLNGSPVDVTAGDWFVGKAAATAVITHPILGQVQLFNTHLYAKGGDEGADYDKAHRLVNAWEFAKLAREAAHLGRYVIAAGDFNSVPTTLPMDIIRDHAGLTDAWVTTHPDTPDPSLTSPPTPGDAILLHGITADSPLNTYSAGKYLEPLARKFQGKRLDYVFYTQPNSISASPRAPILRAVDTRVVMTEHVPGCSFSFSDHFGLEATFEIEIPDESEDPVDSARLLWDPQQNRSFVLPQVQPTHSAVSPESLSQALNSLTARYRFAKSQGKSQLAHFIVCLVVLLAIVVASAWFPFFINPVAVLITIALAWYATTMLYIGFVYGKWEEGALTNIIEELEIHRDALIKQ